MLSLSLMVSCSVIFSGFMLSLHFDPEPGGSIQNYWAFSLCPSSGILEARIQNVSETGFVFRPQVRGLTSTLWGPLERGNLSHRTTHVRFATDI
jgi:hypothetical protein